MGGPGRDGTDTDVNTSQASTSTEGTPVPIATEHARLKGLEVRSVGPGIDESRCRLESRPVDVEDGQRRERPAVEAPAAEELQGDGRAGGQAQERPEQQRVGRVRDDVAFSLVPTRR